MEIKIIKKINTKMKSNQMNIILEYPNSSQEINEFLDYLKHYTSEIIVKKEKQFVKILYEDIILFYSKEKENYCRTKDNEYKVKSKLYELEKFNQNFMRVSKKCIVNVNHIECFDIKGAGRIIVRLDNGDEVKVSRRKIRDVIEYLDDRRI